MAGGLALGARQASRRRVLKRLLSPRRTVLGVPIGRKRGLMVTAQALGTVAKELGSATRHVSNTSEDVHEIREQLKAANKQSPIEVLLNGLTHRRGAHKSER